MAVKVSVIIPVYNVENYIEECINSLLKQTLREIEIICVDDGSTDGTLKLLRKFEADDKRIRLIQQKNQYAGVARNNGMKHASGEYLLFLDSDDFFDETLLEKTYCEAKRTEADVVLFGAQIYNEIKHEVKPMPWSFNPKFLPKKTPFSPADTNGKLYKAFFPSPWTKLFRRDFIEKKELQFQPLHNSNDVFFTFTALGTAERISYVDEPLVYYRKGMKTNLQKVKHKEPLCFLEAYWSVYCELKKQKAYQSVRKGFNDTVISDCLRNYHFYEDVDIQERLLEAFESEKFQEMDLFCEEEGVHGKEYYELKGLIKGHQWRKEQDRKRRPQTPDLITEALTENKVKVSVIVPFYNEEDSAGECLDRILAQTLAEIEIICVNDGSVDGTLEFLKKYAQKDPRIVLASQKNMGSSIARNNGVKLARGEYICFADSDGALVPDALENLYQESHRQNLDILLFDGDCFFDSDESREDKADKIDSCVRQHNYEGVYKGVDLLCEMFRNNEYAPSPCLQMIKKDYFLENELWFYPGILQEEYAFTFQAMLLAERVGHKNQVYYNRRVEEPSVVMGKEGFSEAYGYFISYLCMCKIADMVHFTANQEATIAKMLDQVLNSARKIYHGLDKEEKYMYHCLSGIEKRKFHNFVVFSKYDVDAERKKAACYNKELQTVKKELKKVKQSLSRIKKSKAYKIGLFIVKPFVSLKKIIGRSPR